MMNSLTVQKKKKDQIMYFEFFIEKLMTVKSDEKKIHIHKKVLL